MAPDVLQDTLTFTAKLGSALTRYGAPAHRIEDVLHLLTKDLGVEGVFSATPSLLLMEFKGPNGNEVRIERVYSNDIDLTRLRRLDRLFNQVAAKTVSPGEGLKQLDEIINAPPPFRPWMDLLAFAATSASATPMFGGGLTDIALGFAAGAVVGVVAMVAPPRLRITMGGFAAALVVTLLASTMNSANLDAATLSGIIVLVPGFTLTLGVSELVTHNIAAGVSRLGAALVTALSLSFGVFFGRAAGNELVDLSAVVDSVPADPWVSWAMLPLAVITINILFRAPIRQWGWILLTSTLAFGSMKLSAHAMRPDLAVFIGGLVLGTCSNLYARLKDLPAAIPRMPGLLFLVPGSLSFLSIQAAMSGHAPEATVTAGQLTLVAISLVMGMVIAGSVVPPRKAL